MFDGRQRRQSWQLVGVATTLAGSRKEGNDDLRLLGVYKAKGAPVQRKPLKHTDYEVDLESHPSKGAPVKRKPLNHTDYEVDLESRPTLQQSVAFYTMNECENDLTPRNKEVKLEDEVEDEDGDSNDGHDDPYFMSIISKTRDVLVRLMMS
ncbi:hypothetical protein Tco_0692771 [Tanacetum coccineum]